MYVCMYVCMYLYVYVFISRLAYSAKLESATLGVQYYPSTTNAFEAVLGASALGGLQLASVWVPSRCHWCHWCH